jgi:micrococcal nuclease
MAQYSKIKIIPAIFLLLTLLSYGKGYIETYKGRVISVSDGDSVTVKAKGKKIKLRLFGVDAPEKKQSYGKEAKNYTTLMLYNKFVEIKVISIDKYGRNVSDVLLEDGRLFNQEIVKNGYAWWYSYFAPNDKKLKELEFNAKSKKIGLWKDSNPEEPWKFRKRIK